MSIANPYLQEHLKHNRNVSAETARLRRRATYFSVAVALILVLSKLVAYVLTDSVSLLSSLLDSALDTVVSLITLFSVRKAMVPADEDHRYGHGKIEPLAAIGQAFFIGASSIFLVIEAINRFVHPQAVTAPTIGVIVMVVSIILTLALVLYQMHVTRKTSSMAVEADSLHYKGDFFMNVGVILALILSHHTGLTWFDPAFAMTVAVILAYSAFKIGREAANVLMDRELPEHERRAIENIVLAHPRVKGMHDLRTRSSGVQSFIEFHLEIDGIMPLKAAHDITEEIEVLLYRAFPTAEVLIHQEPAGLDDDRLDDRLD